MWVILLLSLITAVCFTLSAGIRQLWVLPVSFIVCAVLLCLIYWLILGIFSLGVDLKKEYDKPSALYLFLLNAAYWFVCTAGRVRVHISGMEKIPAERRFLFVSNHLSRFDPMIQCLVLRKTPIAFISKPANFKIPIGRRFMNRCCYIPVDRESPRNAAKSISRAVELIKADAVSIGVYPEGHRGNGFELGEFRAGCLKAAAKSKCPIVVSTITGTDKIHQRFPWRRTDVYFDIIDVVAPADNEKTTELAMRIRDSMQRHLKGTSNEIRERKSNDLHFV